MAKYGFKTNQAGHAGVTTPTPPAAAGQPVGVLDAALEQLVQSLMPLPEVDARDEGIRQRMEQAMKSQWRDARVAIFGSAGSGLRVNNSSDVRTSPARRA